MREVALEGVICSPFRSRCFGMAKDDSSKGKKPIAPNILDRSPPFDLSAEMGVLGSLILNPDVANDLALEIRAQSWNQKGAKKPLLRAPHNVDGFNHPGRCAFLRVPAPE